jgi:SAM-dependent methyltransferase
MNILAKKIADMNTKQLNNEEQLFFLENTLFSGTGYIRTVVPPIPPYSIRTTAGSPSMGGHLFVADGWNFLLNNLIGPNSTVLDIGCGAGRMARNLIPNKNIQKYIGFDNYKKSIDWCSQHLTPYTSGKFLFYHLDVFSRATNPSGVIAGENVVFPLENNSVDFIFASSLFTHLLENDCKRYLSEIKRTSKTGCRFLATIHTSPEAGKQISGDEVRMDIESEYFIKLVEEHGLSLNKRLGIIFGQDAFLFTAP